MQRRIGCVRWSASVAVQRAQRQCLATAGWARLGASNDLLRELMGSVAGTKRSRDDDGEGAADRVKRMRVSELRKELADANLDTDGARAQLEERLRGRSA